MSTPGTAQHKTWDYIWNHNQVCASDIFVVHPKNEFVPPDVPAQKVAFVPAASDPLDDLNRPLSEAENLAGLEFINQQLAATEHQLPLSTTRPYVALVARFDPSKGMPNAMAAYALAREKMFRRGLAMARIPQLLIVGNGSADDPDGVPVLSEIMRLRSSTYRHIMDDIKVARVPHNDIAINAVVRNSKLVIQPSTKEGFESRVTDAILQGKPVIGSRRGGIPLQIVAGRSGFIIDPEDTDAWAEHTTVPNALNWLHMSTVALWRPGFAWDRQWVRDLRATSPQQVGRFAPQAPQPHGVPQLQPAG
jgi:glycosyltransferase involved in cell wall biosynthesis